MFDNLFPATVPSADPAFNSFLPDISLPDISQMVAQYEANISEVSRMVGLLSSKENRHALTLFAQGRRIWLGDALRARSYVEDLYSLFDKDRAISALREKAWFELFDYLDLTRLLPTNLWEQWSDSFKAWQSPGGVDCPSFDTDTITSSLNLINSYRAAFFSMRVKCLWDSLSRKHKTNSGAGFRDRQIINGVFNEHSTCNAQARVIQDLYNLCSEVATGIPDTFADVQSDLLKARADRGEWRFVGNGLLKVRAYKVGTLHFQLHPEVASRLNIALHYLYPDCLPRKPLSGGSPADGEFKPLDLIRTQLPHQVTGFLRRAHLHKRKDGLWGLAVYDHVQIGRALRNLLDETLKQIGAERENKEYLFTYDPSEVIEEILVKGEGPETVSHQFYSTPRDTAKEFVEWVSPNPDDICYETSAGTGAIAQEMPLSTYCVEVNKLRCMALSKLGFEVTEGDFLRLKPADLVGHADVVMMNPPFAQQSWKSHFLHGVNFVRPGGVVAAILPASAVEAMPEIEGTPVEYSSPMQGRFPNVSITIVYAKWCRPDQKGQGAEQGSEAA